MGLIGEKYITCSKNTLLATSIVVSVLKKTTCVIGYSHLQQIGKILVPKTVFWTIFASCTLVHGTNWCIVHHI